MSWDNIHVDDFGWVGKLTLQQDEVAVDISSYTTLQYILRPPSGTEVTKVASFDSDGTDGTLKYTFLTGEINATGTWYVQARVLKAGAKVTSKRMDFIVLDKLDS